MDKQNADIAIYTSLIASSIVGLLAGLGIDGDPWYVDLVRGVGGFLVAFIAMIVLFGTLGND